MNLSQESLMPYLQHKSGGLDIDRIAEEVMADWPSSPPQRRKRLLTKLNQIPGCFRADDHHYVYLPRFRKKVVVVLELSDGTRHVLHWQSYLRMPVISKAVKEWRHRVAVAGANAIEVRCIDGEQNLFTTHPTTWQAYEPIMAYVRRLMRF